MHKDIANIKFLVKFRRIYLSHQKLVPINWDENLTLIPTCPGCGPVAALEIPGMHLFCIPGCYGLYRQCNAANNFDLGGCSIFFPS